MADKILDIRDLAILAIRPKILTPDERKQLTTNLALDLPRLAPYHAHEYPISIVCYGPSLKNTWSAIDKSEEIMTCSGAHDFLLAQNIYPTYHVDCDPRPHKSKFTENSNEFTSYLMSTSCPTKTLQQLNGRRVQLWSLDLGKEYNYPPGETLIPPTGAVGLNCLSIAYFLGCRNIKIYGMDCSFESRESDARHAGEHSGPPEPITLIKCGHKRFKTTGPMIGFALNYFNVIKTMPDAKIEVIGTGLLPELINANKSRI